MALIPQEDLDALRELTEDVLRYYGINPSRSFCVPWRDDKRASGYYSDESHLITDYGKNERCNVFQFVGKMEDINQFPEQVRRVAEIVGYHGLRNDVPRAGSGSNMKAKKPRFQPPIVAGFGDQPIEVFKFFREKLFENEKALSYLIARGFDRRKTWCNCLGWCPTRKAILNDDGSMMFTKYEPNAPHGFIVIPFMNREGTSANYAMLRTIPGKVPPVSKEIRPTGYKSPLFREWLLSARCTVLYVTEGLLDALALEMLIEKPCLALGGADFTGRIGSILYYTPAEHRPKKIVLALDDDDAGHAASKKLASDLDYIGIPHSAFQMPEGCKDPNDILMKIGGEDGSVE